MSTVHEQAVRFVHLLMWKVLCYEASPEQFQRVFEDAMQLLEGDRFMPIRAYGSEGDWKADGLLDGGRVVYQVYSPNDVKAPAVRDKVADDLPGAIEHWEDVIEKWCFVYNRRVARGVAPIIADVLNEFRAEYDGVRIAQMNDRDLWDRLRELPADRRMELLGPGIADWEGSLVPSSNGSDLTASDLNEARIVLLHPLDHPVDFAAASEALAPERPFGPPYRLEPDPGEGWEHAAEAQRAEVNRLIDEAGDHLARFAVFSQAPIPLAIHLGFVLSDRVDVKPFQYHRTRRTWAWARDLEPADVDTDIRIEGVPDQPVPEVSDVALRVSLSATVTDADVGGACPEGARTIHLSVIDPDTRWLQHPAQLDALESVFHRTWKYIRRFYPEAERLHVFYAGPAPGAIRLGQSFNPRMNPPLHLYEYNRNQSPRYEHVLSISS